MQRHGWSFAGKLSAWSQASSWLCNVSHTFIPSTIARKHWTRRQQGWPLWDSLVLSQASQYFMTLCVCVTKHFMIVYDILRYDMLWLLIMIYYDILWYVMKLYSSSYCYILLLCDIVRVHRLCVMLFLYTGVLHSPTPFLQIPKNSKACVPTVSSF